MSVLVQVLATIIVCFPCLNLGIMATLPSSTISDFKSLNTTLQRPMTEMEGNLYGSLAPAGGLVGTPIVALLMDRVGRKYCTLFAGVAGVISWTILASTTCVELVLTAVFIGGFSGVSFLVVPAYCSEFCQESIRGTMTAGSMVFYGVGTLVSYVLGGYLEYTRMVHVAMAMAVVQLLLMFCLRESPTVLVKKGKEEVAAKSIAFYRQVKMDSKLVTQELISIRRSLKPNESDLVPEKENADEEESKITLTEDPAIDNIPIKLSLWQNFKKSPPLRRGFLITLVMMAASIFQGLVIVQVYAEPILVESAPSLRVTTVTLSFAVAIVVASVVAAYMSDLLGRRPLIIYSSLAASICCVLLGTQVQLQWTPEWVTSGLMYVFAVVFSFGGGTVPFVMVAEVFLPEVKSIMTMIAIEWMWLCYFFGLLLFYPLKDIIGLGGIFYVFAGMCLLTSLFSAFYVPETKGLGLDEVQVMLAEKRIHRNISR